MTSDNSTKNKIFNHELKLRVISALILGIAVLAITWIGGYTFTLLWAVIAVAIYFEYVRICRSSVPRAHAIAGYVALFLIIGAWVTGNETTAYWMTLLLAVFMFVWEFVVRRSCWASVGLLYAAVPFFAMSSLRGDTELGLFLIFVLFACVWGADVFAFFFGKAIGGPKLAPRLSPKKTWAGFIGSLIGALVVSAFICWLFGYPMNLAFLFLILVLAVISQVGDLMESMLKRTFDVKDSGSLIPGHGGVLDRVDGLIVAGAALWLILVALGVQYLEPNTIENIFRNAFLMP
ncbi:MAG: phosphatidate cytidylyltransferase [Pseudomonadota bacterium]